jgi:hypothetical protein
MDGGVYSNMLTNLPKKFIKRCVVIFMLDLDVWFFRILRISFVK